ncbi:hypothetical protein EYF80_004642 [Liparis tanakae]|uniref:MADF domain-containing protein n=1 Tax=Liparis tanakae TaxID=230148 RepID=A0A4Z2J5P8_9TELE|nr:hypothetical protein EYF80_004642 [Liparis tanakae]
MNAIEELLSEEVRRYEHLYNPSMAGYKDAQMASNSWREISSNVVLAVDLCLKIKVKMLISTDFKDNPSHCVCSDQARASHPTITVEHSFVLTHASMNIVRLLVV